MFSNELKQLRNSKQLTQQELADNLNNKYGTRISKSMISRWESGGTDPQMQYIKIISEYFEVDPSRLLNVENKMIEYFRIDTTGLNEQQIESLRKDLEKYSEWAKNKLKGE